MAKRFRTTTNFFNTNIPVHYNQSTGEIYHASSSVFYKNDFLGPALDTTNDVQSAVEGTSNAVGVNVAVPGTVQIDTGTAADNRNVISGELVHDTQYGLIFQARLKTSTSDANILLFAGMNDAKDEGTGDLPFDDGSHASGTIDSNADDAIGFGVRAETSDSIYAVSVKADGTPQSTDTGTDLTLATYYNLTVAVDRDATARYLLNGDLVATHSAAITEDDPLCWFVGAMITDGSAAAFVDLDYVLVAQNRS